MSFLTNPRKSLLTTTQKANKEFGPGRTTCALAAEQDKHGLTLLTALTAMSLTALSPTVLGDEGQQQPNPYTKPDNSLVTISGTVVDPGVELFELDYGQGTVTVEMDDWDSYGEARALMDGDVVTVYGRIDDNFFDSTSIEAGAVYVDGLNTYFYASSDDEEDLSYYTPNAWIAPASIVPNAMTLRGEVTSVAKEDRSFTVSIGNETVEVETDMLGYNPVDDKGFQQINSGDWVSVSGTLDYAFMDGQVMRAKSITTLYDESS